MVIDGMDVVDEIVSQPRNMITNKPKKPQVMKSVTVDTQGVEYPEPEKLPDPFHRVKMFSRVSGPVSRPGIASYPHIRGCTGFDGGVEAG